MEAKKKKQPSPPGSLAEVLVFYSEPPIAYEPGEEIEVRVISTWDRDRIEREIRKEVSKVGGDVVIVDRSFMKLDRDPQLIPRPPGRRGEPIYTLKIPTRSIYLVGRVGKLKHEGPPTDRQRLYQREFPTVWDAALEVLHTMGWDTESIDTESRYLVTKPIVGASPGMECEDTESGWSAVAFAIYFSNYADETLVRFDVSFLDPSSGEPAACRSTGLYERVFFDKLTGRL